MLYMVIFVWCDGSILCKHNFVMIVYINMSDEDVYDILANHLLLNDK